MPEPSFEVLTGGDGDPLPAERPYGGALHFPEAPRPYVVVNFVASIDGVASLGVTDGTDSTKLSGNSRADRYLMALLRASADVIVIGAGSLRATPGHQWVPAAVAGDQAAVIDGYRTARHGSPDPPPLVVVSASGDLPAHVALDHPATRTAILTSTAGAARVRRAHPAVEVIEVAAAVDGWFEGATIITALSGVLGPGLLLCEGGPSLFARLLGAGAVHELFLTVSPRIAGREHDQARPGIVDGWAADPEALRDATLASVRRSDDHLFLRYRLEA
jgi:riboflavin biosynthesis pyrimidine reductase